MASKSKIEWTEYSWNPIAGCTKCSPGCKFCYAERMAYRQYYMADARCNKNRSQRNLVTAMAYGKAINKKTRKWTGEIGTNRWMLNDPLHWRKPRMIFVCSMSDLFHPKVPFEFIDKVFTQIIACQRHVFQILTKRPARMLEWSEQYTATKNHFRHVTKNAWFGVSVSTQAEADEKIPILLQIPAAVKFVSIEPMLEEIEIKSFPTVNNTGCPLNPLTGELLYGEEYIKGEKLDWVIVGGESGPKARPLHPDWARNIRDQCQAAGTPYFFKQHGEYLHESQGANTDGSINAGGKSKKGFRWPDGAWSIRVTKKKAGRLLDGREWNEYPKENHNDRQRKTDMPSMLAV